MIINTSCKGNLFKKKKKKKEEGNLFELVCHEASVFIYLSKKKKPPCELRSKKIMIDGQM